MTAVSTLSTERHPSSLSAPNERLRQMTVRRSTRSAWLLFRLAVYQVIRFVLQA